MEYFRKGGFNPAEPVTVEDLVSRDDLYRAFYKGQGGGAQLEDMFGGGMSDLNYESV